LVFGGPAWTGGVAATLPDQFAEPLAVPGNVPVAVLSSIARDWSVNDGGHFHPVEEGQVFVFD